MDELNKLENELKELKEKRRQLYKELRLIDTTNFDDIKNLIINSNKINKLIREITFFNIKIGAVNDAMDEYFENVQLRLIEIYKDKKNKKKEGKKKW